MLVAFGADSLIELLSALVVLLQFPLALSTARAARLAGILLFMLAAVGACAFHTHNAVILREIAIPEQFTTGHTGDGRKRQ
ncbi:MAG: hypothetical protein ACLQVL_14570 [Terriglobia bacterium]